MEQLSPSATTETGLCNQRKPMPRKEDPVQPKNKLKKIRAKEILKSLNVLLGWEGIVLK